MFKQVVILAAGRGSRLDRVNTPKPLISVGGTPITVRLLRQFSQAGIHRAVIVVGHRQREVVRGLAGHPELDLEVEFVENPQWEQGLLSSVLAARDHVRGDFIVAMADHLFDDDTVTSIVAQVPGADPVMVVDDRLAEIFELDSAVKVAVRRDARGARVQTLGRSLGPFQAVDAGLFTASDELFDLAEQALRHDPAADLCDVMSTLAARRSIRTLQVSDQWHDIDTPAALTHAEMEQRSRARQAVMRPAANGPAPEDRPSTGYAFTTGEVTRTEVSVVRGAVANIAALDLIAAHCASSPIFVITDTTVDSLYGDAFVSGLQTRGHTVHRIVMEDGEASKSLANYVELVERILGLGIDQNSVLVALGGGAVCNVCGFIASTLYRGVELIHVPTTLMAQADAAISHKQGINGSRGKNLVGSYYPPRRIIVDVDVLATLSDARIVDGLAEVVKHALGQDPAYLERLLAYDGDRHNPDFLESVVRRNIELKCELMAVDPREKREGMVLQYGHTVGHPIEYLSGYALAHGEAVAIGMVVAANVAKALGACDPELVELHRRVIARFGLPTQVPASIATSDIMAAMRFNKTFLREGTRMALVSGPGQLWSVDGEFAIPVPDAVLAQAIDASRLEPARVRVPRTSVTTQARSKTSEPSRAPACSPARIPAAPTWGRDTNQGAF